MSDSCSFKLITGYNCGSYAVNPYQNGINQGALCDVHYWEVECQKLRKDAERYRWIKSTDEMPACFTFGQRKYWIWKDGEHDSFDAAIDAAMGEKT